MDIPPPLCGAEPGTFAQDTIVRRLPEIARRVLAENDWQPAQRARLEALIGEIPAAPLRPLQDEDAPDARAWNQALPRLAKSDWLQTPWFVAEMYFFRRILEATGYYQPGAGLRHDPYALQKQQGLDAALPAVETGAAWVQAWLAEPDPGRLIESLGRVEASPGDQLASDRLVQLLKLSLWGNQVDLSLWPAGMEDRPDHASWQQGEAFLLCDQALPAAVHLIHRPAGRVDVLVDNAGQELAFDLLLAAYLLGSGTARRVVLHLKPHPTYVSDATVQDVRHTLGLLHSQAGALAAVSGWLQGWLDGGRLKLKADYFWTLPYAAWEMPGRLKSSLARSRLVVSKGDANYRRLVGDRHWHYETPFAQVVGYFPAPLLALRVCKAEVVVGLAPGQAERVAQQDAQWLTDGRWGVIQFSV